MTASAPPTSDTKTRVERSARRSALTGIAILVASITLPVLIGIVFYRDCKGERGGGIFRAASYAYAFVSSLILIAVARRVKRVGRANTDTRWSAAIWGGLGTPIFLFGLSGVAWHISTGEWDLVLFYGLVILLPSLAGFVTTIGIWRLSSSRLAV